MLKNTVYKNIWNYNGYSITKCLGGYTVTYNGEEIYFDTMSEAKNFIDSL